MPLLSAYITMLPRIQAQESMQLYQAFAMGSGSFKRADSRRILREWRTAQGQSLRGERTRADNPEQQQQMFAAMGISKG